MLQNHFDGKSGWFNFPNNFKLLKLFKFHKKYILLPVYTWKMDIDDKKLNETMLEPIRAFLNFLKLDVWNFSPKKYDIVNHKSFSISSLFCLHLFFVSLSLPFFFLSSSVFVSFFSLPLCLSHNLCWLTDSLKVKVKQLLKEFVFRQMTSHLKKLHLESFQSNGLRLLDSLSYRFNELSYARVNYNS